MDTDRPIEPRRRLHLSTRRLAILVALAALPLACVRPSGPRPGLWLGVGQFAAGACRDDSAGRTLGPGGHDAGAAWIAGAWDATTGRPRLAVMLRGGRWYGVARGRSWAW